jgi:hypothetical protein
VTPARRFFLRLWVPTGAALAAVVTVHCGLLGAPGEFASGGEDAIDASLDTSAPTDAISQPEAVVLPDGHVVPTSIGTIALVAGERQPTSPEDDPAWSADAWSGILGADGRVTTWRIEKSAPLVGSFDSAGVVGTTWVMINVGFGLSGNRGTAIQSTAWAPGIVGDWRAARANGAPGGLDEFTRAFVGNRLAYVGGTRIAAGVDGGPSTTYFTKEVHLATVDPVKNELGPSATVDKELVVARSRAAVLLSGTSLYVVAGRVPSGLTASVEMAKMDVAAGTLEAFAAQPLLMNAGAEHKISVPAVVAAEGYLFVAGGRINAALAPTDIVLSAKIGADGTLGPFQNVTVLPKPLRDFAFVAFKGRLYVAGGVGATTRSDEVFSATIAPDGTLSAWDASNAKLPGARSDFVAQAY